MPVSEDRDVLDARLSERDLRQRARARIGANERLRLIHRMVRLVHDRRLACERGAYED
jgi:hypothetical protein